MNDFKLKEHTPAGTSISEYGNVAVCFI